MDPIQILLIIVLSLSTFFLAIIGIQLFLTLRALNNTLKRVNKVIDGFEQLGAGMSEGVNELIGFMNGFKVILKAINIISQTKHETAKK